MTLPSRKEVWLLAVVIMLHLANGALVVVNDRLPVVSDSLDYYRWSFQVAERLKEGDITGGGMELFGQALRPPVGILAAVELPEGCVS